MTVEDDIQIPPSSSNHPPNRDSGLPQSSPYYVHPADNPTTVIFTPLLTDDNYCIWERGIRKALSVKAKLGYIDRTITKPRDPTDLLHWNRADYLVGSWVENSVDPIIKSIVMYFPSSREQWLQIKNKFSHKNAPKLFALKQSISSLKQENQNVAMYFTQLKTLWDQLDTFRPLQPCIQSKDIWVLDLIENSVVKMKRIVTELYTSSDCEVLELIKNQLRILGSENYKHGVLYNAPNSERPNQRSFFNPGTTSNAGNGTNKRPRPFCDHCNKHGHTRITCWKLNGYPKDPPRSRDIPTPAYATAATVPNTQTAPGITAAQYARLMCLLEPNNGDTAVTLFANFAGITLTCSSNV
ncbi:uncharacterized protein LOC113326234 [Papaver somniferum]|uniref:uncharacterized protein LOC113326234 n=1 Tax=Papaver somniferum TaxID=3469 RepID=UPI000E6FF6DB|nr:uncharacterized protein LOC113326234 [Papaver somniferum]